METSIAANPEAYPMVPGCGGLVRRAGGGRAGVRVQVSARSTTSGVHPRTIPVVSLCQGGPGGLERGGPQSC